MIQCENCSNDISKKAVTCPKCGHPNKRANDLSGGQIFFYLVFGIGAIWWWSGGGGLSQIEKQVATDAVNQYNIAKRQGDTIQICVQAGLVSAAYLQAKEESNYQQWKNIEAADCKRAGVPH